MSNSQPPPNDPAASYTDKRIQKRYLADYYATKNYLETYVTSTLSTISTTVTSNINQKIIQVDNSINILYSTKANKVDLSNLSATVSDISINIQQKYAPLNNPVFTGIPLCATAEVSNNSVNPAQIATVGYVSNAISTLTNFSAGAYQAVNQITNIIDGYIETYNSKVNITDISYLNAGATGQILLSNGNGVPNWSSNPTAISITAQTINGTGQVIASGPTGFTGTNLYVGGSVTGTNSFFVNSHVGLVTGTTGSFQNITSSVLTSSTVTGATGFFQNMNIAGNMGIGKTNPSYTLDVSGTINTNSNLTVGGTIVSTGLITAPSISGSAATLTTARNIGGVAFNGSADINLPGVNISTPTFTPNATTGAVTITLPANSTSGICTSWAPTGTPTITITSGTIGGEYHVYIPNTTAYTIAKGTGTYYYSSLALAESTKYLMKIICIASTTYAVILTSINS